MTARRWFGAGCDAVLAVLLVVITLAASVGVLGADPAASDANSGREPPGLAIELDSVASGFGALVLLVGTGDGSGDRYIVEQLGRIWRLSADGAASPELVLDINGRVLHHNERGLLGLAVHPRVAQNGRIFVLYSRRGDGATMVSEFTLPGFPERHIEGEEPAEPRPIGRTELPLLVIPQLYTTHKGGMLAFDDEGMLLVGSGDGGAAWDPHDQGQDPASLLGKLLRIDVDGGWPYAIPDDNGFLGVPGARGEVHAMGLRNPWRFSIDTSSGDIYIGDVGQDSWEEIDVLQWGEREVSFGWSDVDGETCLLSEPCDDADYRAPSILYSHVDGDVGHCGVVGGYAYRGVAGTLPQGTYLYADYCSGTIWAVPVEQLLADTAVPTVVGRLDPAFGLVQSFGEDDAGELYLLTSDGAVLRIATDPLS